MLMALPGSILITTKMPKLAFFLLQVGGGVHFSWKYTCICYNMPYSSKSRRGEVLFQGPV